MRSAGDVDFSSDLGRPGVFGPEVVFNTRSGQACLRSGDGRLQGAPPDPPLTNAFVAWVGRPVLVVSQGVDPADVEAVAAALREFVGVGDLPVLFSLGRSDASHPERFVSACASPVAARELAKATAYVLVQCAWAEGETIIVELDGEAFDFRLEFEPVLAGGWGPVLT